MLYCRAASIFDGIPCFEEHFRFLTTNEQKILNVAADHLPVGYRTRITGVNWWRSEDNHDDDDGDHDDHDDSNDDDVDDDVNVDYDDYVRDYDYLSGSNFQYLDPLKK